MIASQRHHHKIHDFWLKENSGSLSLPLAEPWATAKKPTLSHFSDDKKKLGPWTAHHLVNVHIPHPWFRAYCPKTTNIDFIELWQIRNRETQPRFLATSPSLYYIICPQCPQRFPKAHVLDTGVLDRQDPCGPGLGARPHWLPAEPAEARTVS